MLPNQSFQWSDRLWSIYAWPNYHVFVFLYLDFRTIRTLQLGYYSNGVFTSHINPNMFLKFTSPASSLLP